LVEQNGQATRFFCQRLRDTSPLELVSSLVSALGDGKVDAIADLHRRFNGIHLDTRAGVAMLGMQIALAITAVPIYFSL
jgi:hypothetical protein